MLEVRYILTTREVTAWCADETQFGNLSRGDAEAIAVLDIPIPDRGMLNPRPLDAWLYDKTNKKLVSNPDYVEPKHPRDLAAEIDELREWRVEMERK